jgi:type IV secretory pathway VirB10-like protein
MREDFEDYIRERREQTEQTRRLLIGVLAATCIALAISNVALALWITSGRTRQTAESPAHPSRELSARPAPVAEPPPPSASIPSRPDPPPSVTLPKTTEPAPAEPRTASAPAERTTRAETPRAERRPSDEPASPALELPPRSPAPTAAAPRAAANTTPAPARAMSTTPGFAAPEEAASAWMLTTYGRRDAEARARAALEFYDATSAEGRYWRRVLGLITAAR